MNNGLFWLLAGGHFLTDFYANFLPALLPVMVRHLHISLTAAGLVVTAASLATNFFQPVMGYMFDRRPSRVWLAAAILISAVFMCLAGLMPSYGLFLLFPVLSGLGSSAYHPAGSSYTYRISEERRGFLVSVFTSMGFLGFALAPMVAAYFINFGGLEALVWMIFPGLVLTAAFAAINFNRRLLANNQEQSGAGSGKPVITRIFVLLMVIMILRAWGNIAMSNYLPFLLKERGYSYTFSETILTLFLVLGAVGGILGARISDQTGRKNVIQYSLLGSTIFAVFFMMTRGPLSLGFLLLCGLMLSTSQPVMVVLSQELMPNNIALASGVSMGFVWGVGSLGVALNGWVGDHFSLAWSFWLAALVLLLATLLAWFFPTVQGRVAMGGDRSLPWSDIAYGRKNL